MPFNYYDFLGNARKHKKPNLRKFKKDEKYCVELDENMAEIDSTRIDNKEKTDKINDWMFDLDQDHIREKLRENALLMLRETDYTQLGSSPKKESYEDYRVKLRGMLKKNADINKFPDHPHSEDLKDQMHFYKKKSR